MFLRKEKKTYASGTYLAPFCKDCDSQDIEIIQTCKKCGSHNVVTDWSDKRSEKIRYVEKEAPIYKCDKCGKEFNGLTTDNIISYDGEFNPFKCSDEYTDVINYTLEEDLCPGCKQVITDKLNKRLNKLLDKEYVFDVAKNTTIKKK